MTITQEHAKMLNSINSATQRAGLGDLLVEIESKAGGGDIKKSLNAFREELDEILELIGGMEGKINALGTEDKYSKSIAANEKSIAANTRSISAVEGSISAVAGSVSALSSKLDQFIKSSKKEVAEVVTPPMSE